MKRFSPAILLVLISLAIFGCSSSSQTTAPGDNNSGLLAQTENSQVIASGLFNWDGKSDSLSVEFDRANEAHYNVTYVLYPGNFYINIVDFDLISRVMTVDVTLNNPTLLDVYDMRVILQNLGAKKLMNPDDYTKMFDRNTPPVANPFKAYAKDEAQRKFWNKDSAPEHHIKTETFEIYFPTDNFSVPFIITVSWPSNASEPYDIENIQVSGALFETSGVLDASCDVYDWQDVTADFVIIENNPVTGSDVEMLKTGTTKWEAAIANTGGAAPGTYEAWIAAYDSGDNYALYNRISMTVQSDTTGWGDPIVVTEVDNLNEILPRIVLRGDQIWIIYTNGTDCLAKYTTDDGMTWNGPVTIGSFPGIDTIHAVLGGDNGIYVQYQTSNNKNLYISKYDGTSWSTPALTTYHALTVEPYSCDLGIDSSGYVYDMLGDAWSAFGFMSTYPNEATDWTDHRIASFFNAVYSINDGFVQWADEAKFFFVHEETDLIYAWHNTLWNKNTAMSGTEKLIEPAIAPESDLPYHGVMTVDYGSNFNLEYFRFDSTPPSTPQRTTIYQFHGNNIFHSISVDGDKVSIAYDADGDVLYAESLDGGDTFTTWADTLSAGDSMYSHVRRDQAAGKVVAAYAKKFGTDYDIYIRIKY
jgi:hypothetical protein